MVYTLWEEKIDGKVLKPDSDETCVVFATARPKAPWWTINLRAEHFHPFVVLTIHALPCLALPVKQGGDCEQGGQVSSAPKPDIVFPTIASSLSFFFFCQKWCPSPTPNIVARARAERALIQLLTFNTCPHDHTYTSRFAPPSGPFETGSQRSPRRVSSTETR